MTGLKDERDAGARRYVKRSNSPGTISANVLNGFSVFRTEPLYGSNSVILDFLSALFATFAKTPNQIAVANALDRVSTDPRESSLLSFLYRDATINLPADFDKSAPDELGSLYEISFSFANVAHLRQSKPSRKPIPNVTINAWVGFSLTNASNDWRSLSFLFASSQSVSALRRACSTAALTFSFISAVWSFTFSDSSSGPVVSSINFSFSFSGHSETEPLSLQTTQRSTRKADTVSRQKARVGFIFQMMIFTTAALSTSCHSSSRMRSRPDCEAL
jgi:hypothetical protein